MVIIVKKEECCHSRHKFVTEQRGCKENPGCWDMGDGSMVYHSQCVHCGLLKIERRYYTGCRFGSVQYGRYAEGS